MASDKYKAIARGYLNDEVDRLAEWLEANVNKLREERGENAVIIVSRNNSLDVGEDIWTYGNISFELECGDEIL